MSVVYKSLKVEEKEELNKELECPVCLDILKKPKLLACTHTFCLECLENLVKEKGDGAKAITCPTCREVTKIKGSSASLYPNYIVQNLIKKLQDAKNGDGGMKCGECIEFEAANKFCHDCRMAMCTSCAEHHHKSKRFSQHRMENIESVQPKKLQNTYQYCTTHNELLKYFCKECSVMICHDCMISKVHRQHERGLIEEILDDKKEEINALVMKGKETIVTVNAFFEKADQSLADAFEQKETSVNVIEDAFNSIFQALNERKEVLLSKVNDPYDKSFKSIEQAKQKGKVLIDMLKYAVKLAESEEGENLEALSGVITQLTESLLECDMKEGEKVKYNEFVAAIRQHQQFPQHQQFSMRQRLRQQLGHQQFSQQYFNASPSYNSDGSYYGEVQSTEHYQFFKKNLISNSKVGNIDIEVQRVNAVLQPAHAGFVDSIKNF